MPVPNVDLVFVIDASESMQSCFDALRIHLASIIQPMQGYTSRIRFGLVAQSAGAKLGKAVYDHQFLCGSGPEALKKLYGRGPNDSDPSNEFFTDNPETMAAALTALRPKGNEDMLVALDIAADFPFGPVSNTKRVIAMFSDERLEDGVSGAALIPKIPELIGKLQGRHIKLFVAGPDGPAIQQLAMADRSEVELVDGGDGLRGVDFKLLLGQMGKSISGSSLQAIGEPSYRRALFSQDRWGSEEFVSAAERDVVLRVGEAATLDTTQPLRNVRVRMDWTRAIDLDLHAIYRMASGEIKHVYFSHKSDTQVCLDVDAGVGDVGGLNEENIVVERLDGIREILFATHIYGHGDRFSDYDARVMVETDNGDRITVPLTAQQCAEWCVIARIDNDNPEQPQVINVNRVMAEIPVL